MADENDTCRILGDLLRDKIGEPLSLKLHFLQAITKNFSPENRIGSGGYGEVYKGVLEDDFVAVKKIYSYHVIEDEPFHREVASLMSIDHDNIVFFVGYCAETQEEIRQHGGKNIFVEIRERLLCFEYLRKGSLHKYLTAGEPCGLPWRVCYKIIKGICMGLHYLHERHIIHLDLKPDNILLDDSMVPKIADFGLSRLLSDEKSHITTQTKCGTWGYMAPEYLEGGKITTKSDIFSLGVIIRDLVKGLNTGATTDQDVLRCWVNRIGQIELEIGYQKQIEACIEISQRCTKRKPEDRPSMQDILHTLEKVEAGVVQSVVGRHEVTKFGPWGGDGGKPRDIKMTPYRLDSITISSGIIVDSIEFSYTDHDGQCHATDPWGGHGGDNNSIQLGPSEFLTGVSGTVGPFKSLMNVITSLTFVTNSRSYGPFGRGRGTPFHIQMQINNGWIVGFFGRSNRYLEAIGVYTNQETGVARIGPSAGDGRVLHDITDHNGEHYTAGPSGEYHKVEFAKFGPWGGDGGEPRDIKMVPYRLDTVTISSGTVIDSIEFSYTDQDGQCHATGPWGGHGGDNNSFQLGPSEFLTGVSGSIGSFKSQRIITSLTFVTNARSYGPFGKGKGTSFHIPMKSNGCIVGFFGRSGRYLHAIGVYTNHESERVGQKQAGIARIGPWGGAAKVLHDIIEKPHHLERVTIFSGTIINSLEYLYTDHNGQQHTAGPWGGCGGTGRKIHLDSQEFIVEVSGTFHPCGWDTSIPNVVSSLTLTTNTGKSHGPFGTELGTAFHVLVQRNSRIVGFFAHGENYIEAIGAYVLTL